MLFTVQELQKACTGFLSTVTSEEHQRAHDYAEAAIIAHCESRYEAPSETSGKVFKQIGLKLGMWSVVREHFNNQDHPAVADIWAVHEAQFALLKAIAKGTLTSDASSVEVTRQRVIVSIDETTDSVFGESETRVW